MTSDLTPDQQELAVYMSKLSEEAYFAGWMADLEFDLWEAMNGKIQEYGRLKFTVEHKDRLRTLSQRVDGWIIFCDQGEETFISTTEFQQMERPKRSRTQES